jgi:hypothetical protein
MGLSVAARYNRKLDAQAAYQRIGHLHQGDLVRAGLSIFYFWSDPYWYVAVVGDSEDLKDFVPLATLLAKKGQIIALPDPTHDALLAERAANLTLT